MRNANCKTQKVRKCLLSYNALTPMECVQFFNHWRLADVVWDLRNEGYDIKNVGQPGKHAVYIRQRKHKVA